MPSFNTRLLFLRAHMGIITVSNGTLFSGVTEDLKRGKTVTIPVKGNSMLPLIRDKRDCVTLEGIEAGSPLSGPRKSAKNGDIVLFKINETYVLHRILDIRNGTAFLQGDGNVSVQEKCNLDHIYGRVIEIIRPDGKAFNPGSAPAMFTFRIWLFLRPLRRYFLAAYRRLVLLRKKC